MTTSDKPREEGKRVRWDRVAGRLAAAVVAAVAGAASFEHIASVALRAGERVWVAYSLPFAIDGLIVVGVVALLEDQRRQRHGRLSARLAVLVGVIATLAANVASAEPTVTARLVALAAPVAFLLSVEVLTRSGRDKAPTVIELADQTHQPSSLFVSRQPEAAPAQVSSGTAPSRPGLAPVTASALMTPSRRSAPVQAEALR